VAGDLTALFSSRDAHQQSPFARNGGLRAPRVEVPREAKRGLRAGSPLLRASLPHPSEESALSARAATPMLVARCDSAAGASGGLRSLRLNPATADYETDWVRQTSDPVLGLSSGAPASSTLPLCVALTRRTRSVPERVRPSSLPQTLCGSSGDVGRQNPKVGLRKASALQQLLAEPGGQHRASNRKRR
jgi:hypothetical protein